MTRCCFVQDMVAWPASQCCTDFPSTYCEHVEPMTPCAADFLPEAFSYTWCDLSSTNLPPELCNVTPDCQRDGNVCECRSQSSCEFLGGHFVTTRCKDALKYWPPSIHKDIKEALDRQTCEGRTEMKQHVDHLRSCCASSRSICEVLDNYWAVVKNGACHRCEEWTPKVSYLKQKILENTKII